MKIDPSHVANFFIKKAEQENIPLSPMKLNKLIYLGFGWVKAVLTKDLFEESIEAWKHGPVVPSIYHEFKDYRDSPISRFSVNVRLSEVDKEPSGLEAFEFVEPHLDSSEPDISFVLKKVWNVYKGFTAWSLREMTHKKGTPWSDAFEPEKMNSKIDSEKIQKHFTEKIQEYIASARDQ